MAEIQIIGSNVEGGKMWKVGKVYIKAGMGVWGKMDANREKIFCHCHRNLITKFLYNV